MSNFLFVGIAAISAVIGIIAGYFVRKFLATKSIGSAEARAERIVEDAKVKQKELILQGQEKAIKLIEEAKHEETKRRQDIDTKETRLEKRESLFDQKLLDLESKQKELADGKKHVEEMQEELKKIRAEQLAKLEKVAALSQEDAKKILLDNVERIAKEDIISRIRKLDMETQDELERRVKELIIPVIQRCAASHSVEMTTTAVALPSDEMKGRIIGKEGRNIKTIEHITGVEIIVDETPNMITLSGFSAIRRQVAKRAIEKLIADGRIHPGRIEETVEEAKRDLALDLKKAGEDTLFELGIAGIDPKLVMILGRLKYRTSYGQNNLQHAKEVALLSGMLAEELGEDAALAKKAGLFHDIGKAVDHEVQGSHTEIGYTILKKFNFPEEIAYPTIGHHEDKPKTIIATIVKAADAISGARPGARKDTLEQYIKRLEDLERVATSFAGVAKTYAIQAGRELRVFVTPEQVDDLSAHKLARDIAQKIEAEMQYPGEIRVTIIRETRVIEYAR